MPGFLDKIVNSARSVTRDVLGPPPAQGSSIAGNVANAALDGPATGGPAYDTSKDPGQNILGALLGPGKTTGGAPPAPTPKPSAPPAVAAAPAPPEKSSSVLSILFRKTAAAAPPVAEPVPAPAPAAPDPGAVVQPGSGTPTQGNWDAVKPSPLSKIFRQQENAARGEEEFVGETPTGEGWSLAGARSGQPVWSRATTGAAPPAPAAPPAVPSAPDPGPRVAGSPPPPIPGGPPRAIPVPDPSAPMAMNIPPVTPPAGSSGNPSVDGYESVLRDYHDYGNGTATGSNLDAAFATRQKALGAVNANLDNYAMRSMGIWNPQGASARRNDILRRHGFNPGFDTMKAQYAPIGRTSPVS